MVQSPGVATRDAITKLRKEGSVSSMGGNKFMKPAAVKVAQIKPFREGCAVGMERRGYQKDVLQTDAPTMHSKEGCVNGMEQMLANLAARKDAQTAP